MLPKRIAGRSDFRYPLLFKSEALFVFSRCTTNECPHGAATQKRTAQHRRFAADADGRLVSQFAAVRSTGYPPIESVGTDLSWIAADGPASESYVRLWHDIYENSAFRGVIEVRRRDGNSLQMELTAIPVRDRDGQITSLVCTGRDLREGQGVEVRLGEARKLNAIATLARAVAHDLNNTLMVISSSSELALDGMSHDNPLWRRLHEIHSAAQRACELAGEMLAFGRNR
jgi:PAS domain S-box-containing protein